MEAPESTTASHEKPVFLYDGQCGMCSAGVHFWEKKLSRYGFDFAPLQDEQVTKGLEISRDALMKDMHLILPSGEALRGADAYRYVARHVWWLSPLYWLSVVPGLKQIVNLVYRRIADNRYQVARVCGFKSTAS